MGGTAVCAETGRRPTMLMLLLQPRVVLCSRPPRDVWRAVIVPIDAAGIRCDDGAPLSHPHPPNGLHAWLVLAALKDGAWGGCPVGV